MKKRQAKFEFTGIGVIQTCFKEKFGIPRQSGMVSNARGTIKLEDDPDLRTALKGMETFSHLWVFFIFHEHGSRNWKPSIRPPRLGGARRVGVLASRSPHRPNPIGLSVVKIEAFRVDAPGGAEIDVSGVDILDGSPVVDLKPYIPYADVVPGASGGWAEEPIPRRPVTFSELAEASLTARAAAIDPTPEGRERVRALIVEMLELDPRPASQRKRTPAESAEAQGTRHAFMLLDFDVKWEIRDGAFVVLDLTDSPRPTKSGA
jgi:tRNA-Thr(GGU) m(6)t(6)A37 methyltransferase TsaA